MPKKNNGYTQVKVHAKRLRKQQEANGRQAKYEALSRADKIALVINRGGSAKELARVKSLKK
jgi:hypothetical protein